MVAMDDSDWSDESDSTRQLGACKKQCSETESRRRDSCTFSSHVVKCVRWPLQERWNNTTSSFTVQVASAYFPNPEDLCISHAIAFSLIVNNTANKHFWRIWRYYRYIILNTVPFTVKNRNSTKILNSLWKMNSWLHNIRP